MKRGKDMEFGVCLPNYGSTFDAGQFVFFAKKAEELGFSSVWTTDHILMSEHSGTPYERIMDSIVSLAAASMVTKVVRLGISSLVMAMRNPVIVAKQICTIDHLSAGRVILATGAGWNEREFKNLGVDFHRRGKILDGSISLIRLLWSSDGKPVNFRGKHLPHNIVNGMFSPPPVQKKLEVWIAGISERAMKRAAELGDAWHPNLQPLDKFGGMVARFRSFPGGSRKPVNVRAAYNPDLNENEYTSPQGERRLVLSGLMGPNESILEEIRKMGVSYVVLAPDPLGNTRVEKQVESLKKFALYFMKK